MPSPRECGHWASTPVETARLRPRAPSNTPSPADLAQRLRSFVVGVRLSPMAPCSVSFQVGNTGFSPRRNGIVTHTEYHARMMLMASISAFQADRVGSSPTTCSILGRSQALQTWHTGLKAIDPRPGTIGEWMMCVVGARTCRQSQCSARSHNPGAGGSTPPVGTRGTPPT